VISQAVSVFAHENAVLTISGSVVVVGDIHGNLSTLVRLFTELGYPDARRFVFLGDYIDRGAHSCEVLIFLYALKVLFPTQLFLLRGNHELRGMTESYGFQRECLARFIPRVYSSIVDSFSFLPIGAIINDRFFCVHGGLTPNLSVLSIQKESEEVLWSDPRADVTGFLPSDRGRGFYFGRDAVAAFLQREGFELVIRSHEHFRDGFDWPFGEEGGCLTIFSSVDYCGQINDGSVCILGGTGQPEIYRLPYRPLDQRHRLLIPSFVLEWDRFSPIECDEPPHQRDLDLAVKLVI
jgi:protein phosphatase